MNMVEKEQARLNNNMEYKFIISSAGIGSRLDSFTKHINKSLVTIQNKPSICHIIEKIPDKINIVIPVGYKASTVIDFLSIAYPKRNFEFVEVNPFDGPGSGLGYSLIQCKDLVQTPFVFSSNDTLIGEKEYPSPEYNWMGLADVDVEPSYRTAEVQQGLIVDVLSKGSSGENIFPYIGLCGINDYELFWEMLEKGCYKQEAITIGESYALKSMVNNQIKAKYFQWYDTGNKEALEKTKEKLIDNRFNILEKENEAIWFMNDKVIKFSTDRNFIKNRIQRSKMNPSFFPKIIDESKSMYSYEYIDGEIISKNPNSKEFSNLLTWLSEFWQPKNLTESQKINFQNECLDFYRNKTISRIELYYSTFEQRDEDDKINGKKYPKLSKILDQIDWQTISNGFPVNFHGDLHYENILRVDSGFKLLDWRQDFAGIIDYGDIYYDFGKLKHGFIINHEIINNNHFKIFHKPNEIIFDFHRTNNLVEIEKVFDKYLEENSFDLKKANIITALIFLNIAGLHHYPYSLLLYYLGKTLLYEHVNQI